MIDWLAVLICTFYGLSFAAINWARFFQFQSFYYDLGIFARAIFLLSRFQSPVIDHYTFGLINEFGDHFNPGLALLAPLFWLTKNPVILMTVQSLAVALAGWFLFQTSKIITKNKIFNHWSN